MREGRDLVVAMTWVMGAQEVVKFTDEMGQIQNIQIPAIYINKTMTDYRSDQ